MSTAIAFHEVSKKYRLRYGWYLSIRDEIARLAKRLVGQRAEAEVFWALRDVSFEIRHGETVGLIGANGAGKSTILKILSRVTVPTSGTFAVDGRVGALIEVGAGFHPDLTGRENVFLNGAIMGMRRAEIQRKFDQIVAFSEVENFIDTPLKFYSSGMMVRLGFAVAAHIEPEILLVDEVLAVGDTAFQAKCLNKIAELKEEDKTIVLVSHSMPSILQNATRVMWVHHGKLIAFGDPDETVEAYLRAVQDYTATLAGQGRAHADSVPIRITRVTLLDASGQRRDVLKHGEPATIEIGYEILDKVDDPVVSVSFNDVHGFAIGGLTSRLDDVRIDTANPSGIVRLRLAPVLFTRGSYSVTAALYDSHIRRYYDLRPQSLTFMVDGPSVASREVSGNLVLPHQWEIRQDATRADAVVLPSQDR
jgi:ABC-type polysaccharide/polyol phosphate transport system ATPase subunit